MKYTLTTVTALSFGSLSYRLAAMLGWTQLQERLFVFAMGIIATAFLCAPLWA